MSISSPINKQHSANQSPILINEFEFLDHHLYFFSDNNIDNDLLDNQSVEQLLHTCNSDLFDILVSSIDSTPPSSPRPHFSENNNNNNNNTSTDNAERENSNNSQAAKVKRAFDELEVIAPTQQIKKKRKSKNNTPSFSSPLSANSALNPRGVKINKLLELLTKEQLKTILTRLVNEDPTSQKKIISLLPSFDLHKSLNKAHRLILQIQEKFPHNTKFCSSYDHYTFLQLKPFQTLYISFVINQIKSLYDAKQYPICLTLLLEFIEMSEDLPNWDVPDDRSQKLTLYKHFASYLLKVLKKTNNEIDIEKYFEIAEVSNHFNTPNFGSPFNDCLEFCNLQINSLS